MQSTRSSCLYCGSPVTRSGRTFCSKSCSIRARSYAFRGVRCSVEGCERLAQKALMCEVHRSRMLRNGHTDLVAKGVGVPEVDRFWSRVDRSSNGCWLWTGEVQNRGYGVFYTYSGGKRIKHLAHRYSLALVTPLVPGLVCRHSCDTPRCVNPSHLSQGTQLDNMRDAIERGRMNMSGLALGRRGVA